MLCDRVECFKILSESNYQIQNYIDIVLLLSNHTYINFKQTRLKI